MVSLSIAVVIKQITTVWKRYCLHEKRETATSSGVTSEDIGTPERNKLWRTCCVDNRTRLLLLSLPGVCVFIHLFRCPLRKIRVSLPGQAQQPLPGPASVCSIFLCPDNGMDASV